jgi:hypothetical protein
MKNAKRKVAAMVTMSVMLVPGVAVANDTHGTSTSKSNTTTATFDGYRAMCVKSITDRQTRLDRAAAAVANSPDARDAQLTAIILVSKSSLIALQAEIDSDTGDLAALKEDCKRIVTDNRIYALRLPQINLVMSVDRLNASSVKFDALHAQLVAAIAAANAAGDPDATEATETLTKLEAKLASAKATLDGIDVDALRAITPADYNANKKVLQPYLQAVRSAHSDVKKAAKSAKYIAQL